MKEKLRDYDMKRVSQLEPGTDADGDHDRADYATSLWTLTTEVGGNQDLIDAPTFIRVGLRLESAGPVAVSTKQDIVPIFSGRGALLNDVEMIFTLPRGAKLFYTAISTERVRVRVEPVAFQGSILKFVERGFDRMAAYQYPVFKGIAEKLGVIPGDLKSPHKDPPQKRIGRRVRRRR